MVGSLLARVRLEPEIWGGLTHRPTDREARAGDRGGRVSARAIFLAAIALWACVPLVEPVPDGAQIVRESVVAGNEFPPLDRTIGPTDAAALRSEILALPPKTVEKFCPNDSGMRYRLVFSGPRSLTVVLEAGGCRYAFLSPLDVRETTEQFWAHLAGALGFYTRGYDLYPTPLPRESPPRRP